MLHVKKYDGDGEPPAMHWKACHSSTVSRFKALFTCAAGHTMTLGGHAVAADGTVTPSVVCLEPGCSFHEHIRFDGWTLGAI